jgi:hypothetical protein
MPPAVGPEAITIRRGYEAQNFGMNRNECGFLGNVFEAILLDSLPANQESGTPKGAVP